MGPTQRIKLSFVRSVLPKYKHFLQVSYSYPLIIEAKEFVQFKDLVQALFVFYEENKNYLSSMKCYFEDGNIFRIIYNDIKHPRKKVDISSYLVFEYDDKKKLFKFIKNSIKAKFSKKGKESMCNDIESLIQKIVSKVQSAININHEGLQSCRLEQSYYPFVHVFYHLTETPLLVENPITNISISYIKLDGSSIDQKDIDYKYNIYRVDSDGTIIESMQCNFIPIVCAEYITDKVFAVCINYSNKGSMTKANDNKGFWSFKEDFHPLANQSFEIAIDRSGNNGHLLYAYNRENAKKIDKKIIELKTLA